MARKKHIIFRLHKIKIHPNRWLAWAICYALIMAIAMVGYIQVSEINFETGLMPENHFVPWRAFTNKQFFYSLRYPADWSIEAQDKSTILFVPSNSTDEGVSLAVLKPSAETAIRNSIKNIGESRIVLDNYRAVKISNDLGQGHFETVVMSLRHGRLYVLRGTDAQVQKLILTFNFLD